MEVPEQTGKEPDVACFPSTLLLRHPDRLLSQDSDRVPLPPPQAGTAGADPQSPCESRVSQI